jgi:endonuclease I
LYTGHRHDPAKLIAEDFRIAEMRSAERARLNVADPALEAAAMEDAVEAALPYDCEHVVPQSWFGKAEPVRGDLHHMFACETRCNSFRGNTRYTEFADFPNLLDEVVRTDCGKSESTGFEPAHGKGAAARAVFISCSATGARSARRKCHRSAGTSSSPGTNKTRCRNGSGTATPPSAPARATAIRSSTAGMGRPGDRQVRGVS